MGLFRRRNTHAIPEEMPVKNEIAPTSDALPAELASTIGAAFITVRSGEGDPAIIQFSGWRSVKYDRDVLRNLFGEMSPGLSEAQTLRAMRFLDNRIVEQARQQGEADILSQGRERRGRWADWKSEWRLSP